MIVSAEEFYSLIRLYFIEMAESQRTTIAPMFGHKRDVAVTDGVYLEYMNQRAIIISADEEYSEEEWSRLSDFSIFGHDCILLTVHTKCQLTELPSLWRIRTAWIEEGITPVADH